MDPSELMARVVERMADKLAAMEATSPEVVRAVKACHALRCGSNLQSRFESSFVTTRIQRFWSHSWQGHPRRKMLSLLFLYNHAAAVILSTLVALLVSALFAAQYLPGPGWENNQHIWVSPRGFWATVLGSVTYFSVLQLWQPQQSVFVDVMCINQEDPDAKLLGLLSMGAFLKQSESMLVLWDESYTRRLWCVFELAAFLRSRPAGARAKLYVRPLILGPCSVLLTFSTAVVIFAIGWLPQQDSLAARILMWAGQVVILLVGLCAIISVTRGYFRALDHMRSELMTFSLEKTHCWCCSINHMNEDGGSIICDRKVLYKCITTWYGSVEAFEEVVRTEVLQILLEELPSQFLTYRHCITATIPLMWSNLDSYAAGVHYRDACDPACVAPLAPLLRGTAWWLGFVPSMFVLGMRLSCALRQKRAKPWCDALVTFFIILCTCISFVGVIQLEQLNYYIFNFALNPITDDHPFLTQGVWLGVSLLFALVSFAIGPYSSSMTRIHSCDVSSESEEVVGHHALQTAEKDEVCANIAVPDPVSL